MCMGRSGGADPGGAPTRPSPEGPGVFTAVLDGRALFEAGAASPAVRDGAGVGSKRTGGVIEPTSMSPVGAGDAGEVGLPFCSVHARARQHRGNVGSCAVVWCRAERCLGRRDWAS